MKWKKEANAVVEPKPEPKPPSRCTHWLEIHLTDEAQIKHRDWSGYEAEDSAKATLLEARCQLAEDHEHGTYGSHHEYLLTEHQIHRLMQPTVRGAMQVLFKEWWNAGPQIRSVARDGTYSYSQRSGDDGSGMAMGVGVGALLFG